MRVSFLFYNRRRQILKKLIVVLVLVGGLLTLPTFAQHSADISADGQIELSELLRVVQLYNNHGLYCDPELLSEDGYIPGVDHDREDCNPHDSDYGPQDWRVNLTELLRVVQFFNSDGYHLCYESESEDGYCVGVDPRPLSEVPDVRGMTEETAIELLTEAGFIVSVEESYNSTILIGLVANSEPRSGSLAPTGGEVTIVVSLGPAPEVREVEVPVFAGLTLSEAQSALTELGLVLGVVTEDYNEAPVGEVIDQHPPSGITLAEGSTINLVVSLGPEPVGDLGVEFSYSDEANPPNLGGDGNFQIQDLMHCVIRVTDGVMPYHVVFLSYNAVGARFVVYPDRVEILSGEVNVARLSNGDVRITQALSTETEDGLLYLFVWGDDETEEDRHSATLPIVVEP